MGTLMGQWERAGRHDRREILHCVQNDRLLGRAEHPRHPECSVQRRLAWWAGRGRDESRPYRASQRAKSRWTRTEATPRIALPGA